jgi:hypothetical protein
MFTAKLSSNKIMSAACLDTSDPAIPALQIFIFYKLEASPLPTLTHGNSNVGLLQCWRIVHSIPGDRHNLALPLESLNNHQLLLGRSAGKDNLLMVNDYVVQLGFCPVEGTEYI